MCLLILAFHSSNDYCKSLLNHQHCNRHYIITTQWSSYYYQRNWFFGEPKTIFDSIWFAYCCYNGFKNWSLACWKFWRYKELDWAHHSYYGHSRKNFRVAFNLLQFHASFFIFLNRFDFRQISARFRYSPHQINSSSIDDNKNQIGVLHRMSLGECDVVASVAPTKSRLLLADFSHPFAYVPVSYLIPAPHSIINFLAAVKPFPISVSWSRNVIIIVNYYVGITVYYL